MLAVDASAVSFFFEVFFSAAGDAAGLSAAVAVSFFFEDFFFSAAGDAAGLSLAAGDASFFVERLCLAGEALGLSPGEGLCANATAVAKTRTIEKKRNLFIVAG